MLSPPFLSFLQGILHEGLQLRRLSLNLQLSMLQVSDSPTQRLTVCHDFLVLYEDRLQGIFVFFPGLEASFEVRVRFVVAVVFLFLGELFCFLILESSVLAVALSKEGFLLLRFVECLFGLFDLCGNLVQVVRGHMEVFGQRFADSRLQPTGLSRQASAREAATDEVGSSSMHALHGGLEGGGRVGGRHNKNERGKREMYW